MISLVIAAPQSGSGKTTITLGLMAALQRRGLTVAPFKVGPDFIDPGYHRLVTGRSSVNLDAWMCGESFVQETFARHTAGADAAIIEGVMGLFDGISGAGDDGSTAQIAKLLGVPVLLVVDARSQARSAAALIKGFARFDPVLRLAGVIFNNVGSENHARLLREAVASLPEKIPVLGCLPRDEKVRIPSRHLGLVTAEDNPLTPEFIDHLAKTMERNLDLEELLVATTSAIIRFDSAQRPTPSRSSSPERCRRGSKGNMRSVRIAVARDAAFCFIYDDNLRLLEEAGAEIVEFSPLNDACLPEDIAGLYLPGGYPELYADLLAANESMKCAIRGGIEAGMPVYAECGGFIYLTRGLAGAQHAVPLQEFVGIFPVTARMLPRRKALGYREVTLAADALLGPAQTGARGHEFHYSEIDEMPQEIERVYRVRKQGVDLGAEGYRRHNCLASYVHLHFGSNPDVAASCVAACRGWLCTMFLAVLLWLNVGTAVAAPSFDCGNVRDGSIEMMVCRDDRLSDLDRKMAEVFAEALNKAVSEHPPLLKAEQRGWIKGRNDCWKSSDQRRCVEESYRMRIAEVQARYRLVPVVGRATYICNGDEKDLVTATYFRTEPGTLIAERGDRTSLMYQQLSASGARYEGRNEKLWEHQGEATITWGYGSPEMRCKRKE